MTHAYQFRYLLTVFYLCALPALLRAQDQQLFPDARKVLYQDAAHAYDDASVILLSRRRIPTLQSQLILVQQGDIIDIETYAHYTRGNTKPWQKIGATAAGLAIGSLPYWLGKNQSQEGLPQSDLAKGLAPLAGIGVASLPFILDKRKKRKRLNMELTTPAERNGWAVPDAYIQYRLYDNEGRLLESEVQMIDRYAKDAWQKLALRKKVLQDGYLGIELGNVSKRPVWLDGLSISVRPSVEKALPLAWNLPFSDDRMVNKINQPHVTQSLTKSRIAKKYNVNARMADCYTKIVGPIKGYDAPPSVERNCDDSPNNFGLIGGNSGNGYAYFGEQYVIEAAGPLYNASKDEAIKYAESMGWIPREPGIKNWNTMSNSERISHVLNALKYAKSRGKSVNLNTYFSNLPKAGNSGFGKQYRLSGVVTIKGQNVPITMELPIIQSERVFFPTMLGESPKYVGRGVYDQQFNYYYGYGDISKNSMSIFVPSQYNDLFYNFISK